jgi:hypothetical protein
MGMKIAESNSKCAGLIWSQSVLLTSQHVVRQVQLREIGEVTHTRGDPSCKQPSSHASEWAGVKQLLCAGDILQHIYTWNWFPTNNIDKINTAFTLKSLKVVPSIGCMLYAWLIAILIWLEQRYFTKSWVMHCIFKFVANSTEVNKQDINGS